MEVLIINTAEQKGGAAIAASRLLHALRSEGVSATMLVRDRATQSPHVITADKKWRAALRFLWERIVIWLCNGFSRRKLFKVSIANTGFDITQTPEFQRADVIHLHWINQGLLSLSDIRRILLSGKRVIWTLHDMWPITGCCHHAYECLRWTDRCGHCQQLGGKVPFLSGASDLSNRTYRKKLYCYAAGHIDFVACSEWLAAMARKSPLTLGHGVHTIANAIDTDFYAPSSEKEKESLRSALDTQWGIPPSASIILFAAAKVTDPIKGFDLLFEALDRHFSTDNREAHLFIVGAEGEAAARSLSFPHTCRGYVDDPEEMRRLFHAADVLVVASRRENLPNIIAEAKACALPVVAFGVGGIPQMIRHREDGFLAQPESPASLSEGIVFVLDHRNPRQLADAARVDAVDHYSAHAVAQQHLQLYRENR